MRIRCAVLCVAIVGLTGGCGRGQGSGHPAAADGSARAVATAPAPPPARPAAAAGSVGPDILTTTAGLDTKTPTDVQARFAHFQVAPVDGSDTLLVDGKPATYTPEGGQAATAIEANNTLALEGVFELPSESVAWVIIGGGSACPGTHLLVAVGPGHVVSPHELKGCDDRGTIRKEGERLVFDAGGTSGTYAAGRVTPG